MKKLKKMAHDSKRTISDVVNELLTEGIQRRNSRRRQEPASIPTFSMGQPRVDLADTDFLQFEGIAVVNPIRTPPGP